MSTVIVLLYVIVLGFILRVDFLLVFVFARMVNSTSKFAMTIPSKCVCVCACECDVFHAAAVATGHQHIQHILPHLYWWGPQSTGFKALLEVSEM